MPVTLDWYGCATFRMRSAGLNIFLDAYIDRASNAVGTGLCADDIDTCDWIVVGHSHFDHLYGAERIAKNTGAKIICSHESVRVMEQAGVPLEQLICVAGGETVKLQCWEFNADYDLVPDLEVFTRLIDASFEELARASDITFNLDH